jgi:hypothetical protein
LIDDRAVGSKQATRLVDDRLEHLLRLVKRGDARCDLTQGPLRVGSALDIGLRSGERFHQVGVDDRDRGMRRQGR